MSKKRPALDERACNMRKFLCLRDGIQGDGTVAEAAGEGAISIGAAIAVFFSSAGSRTAFSAPSLSDPSFSPFPLLYFLP